MALEVGDGTRADQGGLDVRGSADDRRAGRQPELLRCGRPQRAHDRGGGDQVGQPLTAEPGESEQRVVVADVGRVPVVGHPVQDDRVLGRARNAR